MSIISGIGSAYKKLNEFDWDKVGGNTAKLDAVFNRVVYGVSPEQYFSNEFYKKNHKERRTYLSAVEAYQIALKMIKSSSPEELESIRDKYTFNRTYSKYVHRDFMLSEGQSPDQIRSFIERNGKVIIKELNNTQGKGIRFATASDENLEQTIKEIAGGSYLLEEFVRQHPAMAELNPSSVNTIRIGTALDVSGKGHIVGACLRVGGAGQVVDNFHAGGTAYPVDIENGFVCGPGHSNRSKEVYYINPSTGKNILGFQIPNWEIAKESVKEAAALSDKLRFLGWDVAITEDGVEFIEANIGQGVQILQMDQIGKRKMVYDILYGKVK